MVRSPATPGVAVYEGLHFGHSKGPAGISRCRTHSGTSSGDRGRRHGSVRCRRPTTARPLPGRRTPLRPLHRAVRLALRISPDRSGILHHRAGVPRGTPRPENPAWSSSSPRRLPGRSTWSTGAPTGNGSSNCAGNSRNDTCAPSSPASTTSPPRSPRRWPTYAADVPPHADSPTRTPTYPKPYAATTTSNWRSDTKPSRSTRSHHVPPSATSPSGCRTCSSSPGCTRRPDRKCHWPGGGGPAPHRAATPADYPAW